MEKERKSCRGNLSNQGLRGQVWLSATRELRGKSHPRVVLVKRKEAGGGTSHLSTHQSLEMGRGTTSHVL
jgi:hypothetical protein